MGIRTGWSPLWSVSQSQKSNRPAKPGQKAQIKMEIKYETRRDSLRIHHGKDVLTRAHTNMEAHGLQPLAPVYTLAGHVVRDSDQVSEARGSSVEPLVPGRQREQKFVKVEEHAPQPVWKEHDEVV